MSEVITSSAKHSIDVKPRTHPLGPVSQAFELDAAALGLFNINLVAFDIGPLLAFGEPRIVSDASGFLGGIMPDIDMPARYLGYNGSDFSHRQRFSRKINLLTVADIKSDRISHAFIQGLDAQMHFGELTGIR